jgi:excisionase family DNA binding protein
MSTLKSPPNSRAKAAAGQGTISTTDRLAFTINEAVQLTSLSRSYLYNEVKEKKLRLIKKGSRSLVLRDDLLAYLRGEAT